MNTKDGRVEIAGRSYITPQYIADRMGVSRKTIYRWQKEGLLPPRVKIGRVRLYPEHCFTAWLASKENS